MKVWVFVEGESDRIALNTLWEKWRESLRQVGWGIKIIPLDDKSKFFRKIGHRAAEKLVNNENDAVVGLPDLYPNGEYMDTKYRHSDIRELKAVQTRLVRDNLVKVFNVSSTQIDEKLMRFHPSAFKHDMEMLLLAAVDQLRQVLDTSDVLGRWTHPVEDQNQTRPPKYLVKELFRRKKGVQYRDTVHARAVLEKIADIRTILYNNTRQLQCPIFKELMDWIGSRTGINAC